MATGVTFYASTDSSAPTLTGQTGSLITVLDAILVNGYGSKSAAGAAGAGAWSKAYSGTSKAAYRPSAGNRFYLRVQDDGPGAGSFREARVVGYETMSDVDTGTNPMPTVAQFANGLFVRKSSTADSTARAWKAIADDRTLYFFAATGDAAGVYLCFMWGDFYSHLSGDGYRTSLLARVTENANTTNTGVERVAVLGTASATGQYVQRNRSGTVGALQIGKNAAPSLVDSSVVVGGLTGIPYPNAEDGGLYLMPIYLGDFTTSPANSLRGRLRGLWHNVHPASAFTDGDTLSGVGDFSGKTFAIIKSFTSSGVAIVETSDTWDTSS